MALIQQVYTVPSMVCGATTTSALEMPGVYLNVNLVVPSMAAGFTAATPIYIQASADGVSYYRYSNPESNTTTVGTNDFLVVSACSQRIVNIPNFAFRYVKIETSAVATAGVTAMSPFRFVVISNQ